jgi:hypothetical protein
MRVNTEARLRRGNVERRTSMTAERPGSLSEAFYSNDGKRVGHLVTDDNGRIWLEKAGLDPRVHQLRYPRGWATDAAHLALLEEMGGCGVRLLTTTGERWEASVEAFRRSGEHINRGHGDQVVLGLHYWRREWTSQRGAAPSEEVA